MTVLTIILSILGIYIIYELVKMFDSYMYDNYKYKFFEMTNYIIITISYALLYFGYTIYQSALVANGDTLNGILLVVFGLIGLIFMVYVNIINTDLFSGLWGSLFQFSVFTVLALIGLIILVVMIIFFANTKPVYNIND